MSRHPLFMESVGGDVENNAAFEAIQALLLDDPPEVVAENMKVSGNEALKHGARGAHDAIAFYDKAIACKSSITANVSTYYGNRAQANLILGNNGRAVSDAVQALKLNPQNVKAAYRGAKACSSLKHWSRAIDFSTQGLKFDAENADLRDLLHAAKASKDKEDSLMRKALVEKSRLRRALEQRNAAVDALGLVTGSTMPAHAEAISSASVTVDSSGVVSFPLLLLYDEVGQSDFVQSVSLNDPLVYQLQEILDPQQPPPWDTEKRYDFASVRVYVELRVTPALRNVALHETRGGQSAGGRVAAVDIYRPLVESLTAPGVVIYSNCIVLHVVIPGSSAEQQLQR